VTPINAARVLPPTIDQGWARGLAGTANRSTAEAPIGAISQGPAEPEAQVHSTPVSSKPTNAPTRLRNRSTALTVSGAGTKLRNQRIIVILPGEERAGYLVWRQSEKRSSFGTPQRMRLRPRGIEPRNSRHYGGHNGPNNIVDVSVKSGVLAQPPSIEMDRSNQSNTDLLRFIGAKIGSSNPRLLTSPVRSQFYTLIRALPARWPRPRARRHLQRRPDHDPGAARSRRHA